MPMHYVMRNVKDWFWNTFSQCVWFACDINMITSSNGNISALLALCAGNSPVTGKFPTQRPVTRSFDVFFDLRMNKPMSKQWWGWWFETPSRPILLHCNEMDVSGGDNTISWYAFFQSLLMGRLTLKFNKYHGQSFQWIASDKYIIEW